jgi:hypothetical protein
MSSNDYNLKTWQRGSTLAVFVGLVLCALLTWGDSDRLWRAYLSAFLVCWLISVGGIGLLAIGNLTGGRWAASARPFYLAQMQTLPLIAILFIPIALSVERIFPWAARPSAFSFPPGKAAYLSDTFFWWRAGGYFAVWLCFAWLLARVSRLDQPPASTPAMRRVSAIALVLLAPTTTFAAFDWGMSLEPRWYSSIYGAILSASGVVAAHGLAICGLAVSRSLGAAALRDAITEGGLDEPQQAVAERSAPSTAPKTLLEERVAEIYNDLGNLLLAFLMVFTYFAFSQFLIIWSGNLPTEIVWYRQRLSDGWQWVALAIVVLMFILPFSMLLSRNLKRSPQRLARVAAWLALMHGLHTYWAVVPAFDETGFGWQLTNVAALLAIAGGWSVAMLWHANRILQKLPSPPISLSPAGEQHG